MRNLLALFGLLVLVGVGGGWYMGWYKLSFTRGTEGNLEIRADVDTKKANADSADAVKNLGAVIGNQVEKAAQEAKTTAPAVAPGGTPGPVSSPQTPSFNPLAPTDPTVPPPAPPAPPTRPSEGIQLFPPK